MDLQALAALQFDVVKLERHLGILAAPFGYTSTRWSRKCGTGGA
jgi:hypothetical protein